MQDFAAIDFELANKEKTSICSIGVVVVRGGQVVDTFYSLVKPHPNHYPWFYTRVHGIKQTTTANSPRFPEVWQQISQKIEGLPLVAHDKSIEEHCLKAAFAYYKMPYPNYLFYCTLIASQRQLDDTKVANHRLPTIAHYCGYDLTHRHHALADAEACAAIALKLL